MQSTCRPHRARIRAVREPVRRDIGFLLGVLSLPWLVYGRAAFAKAPPVQAQPTTVAQEAGTAEIVDGSRSGSQAESQWRLPSVPDMMGASFDSFGSLALGVATTASQVQGGLRSLQEDETQEMALKKATLEQQMRDQENATRALRTKNMRASAEIRRLEVETSALKRRVKGLREANTQINQELRSMRSNSGDAAAPGDGQGADVGAAGIPVEPVGASDSDALGVGGPSAGDDASMSGFPRDGDGSDADVVAANVASDTRVRAAGGVSSVGMAQGSQDAAASDVICDNGDGVQVPCDGPGSGDTNMGVAPNQARSPPVQRPQRQQQRQQQPEHTLPLQLQQEQQRNDDQDEDSDEDDGTLGQQDLPLRLQEQQLQANQQEQQLQANQQEEAQVAQVEVGDDVEEGTAAISFLGVALHTAAAKQTAQNKAQLQTRHKTQRKLSKASRQTPAWTPKASSPRRVRVPLRAGEERASDSTPLPQRQAFVGSEPSLTVVGTDVPVDDASLQAPSFEAAPGTPAVDMGDGNRAPQLPSSGATLLGQLRGLTNKVNQMVRLSEETEARFEARFRPVFEKGQRAYRMLLEDSRRLQARKQAYLQEKKQLQAVVQRLEAIHKPLLARLKQSLAQIERIAGD